VVGVPDASASMAVSSLTVSPSFSASRSVNADCQAPVSRMKSSSIPLMETGSVGYPSPACSRTDRLLTLLIWSGLPNVWSSPQRRTPAESGHAAVQARCVSASRAY
jgi:hypothetical protein